jgi:hypothetical protein
MRLGGIYLGNIIQATIGRQHMSMLRWLVEKAQYICAFTTVRGSHFRVASRTSKFERQIRNVVPFVIEQNDVELFGYLQQVNFTNCKERSWNNFAVVSGSVQIVEWLRKNGTFSMSDGYPLGASLLMKVIESAQLPMLRYLWDQMLVSSADFLATCSLLDFTTFSYACINHTDSVEIVEFVYNKTDIDLQQRDQSGQTLLHHACAVANVNVCTWLLSKQPDLVDVTCAMGRTALHKFVASLQNKRGLQMFVDDATATKVLSCLCGVGKASLEIGMHLTPSPLYCIGHSQRLSVIQCVIEHMVEREKETMSTAAPQFKWLTHMLYGAVSTSVYIGFTLQEDVTLPAIPTEGTVEVLKYILHNVSARQIATLAPREFKTSTRALEENVLDTALLTASKKGMTWAVELMLSCPLYMQWYTDINLSSCLYFTLIAGSLETAALLVGCGARVNQALHDRMSHPNSNEHEIYNTHLAQTISLRSQVETRRMSFAQAANEALGNTPLPKPIESIILDYAAYQDIETTFNIL